MILLELEELLNLRTDLEYLEIPKCKGCVYFLFKAGELIYIGKSVNFSSRIKSHLLDKDFDSVYILEFFNNDFHGAEIAYINKYRPVLNKSILRIESCDDPFVSAIRRSRISKGISQKTMADFLGMGPLNYYKIENGKTKMTMLSGLKCFRMLGISFEMNGIKIT